jgi:hypothetical protein
MAGARWFRTVPDDPPEGYEQAKETIEPAVSWAPTPAGPARTADPL